jgi:hypothetical protein
LIAIGVILLFVGGSMPATQTVVSQSCTDGFSTGEFGERVGSGCVEAQTQVPNTQRDVTLFLGFIFSLTGIGGYFVDSNNLFRSNSGLEQKERSGRYTTNTISRKKGENSNTTANDGTKILVSAETKDPETDDTAVSKLEIETTDVRKAKDEFLRHCENQNLVVVSKVEAVIVR